MPLKTKTLYAVQGLAAAAVTWFATAAGVRADCSKPNGEQAVITDTTGSCSNGDNTAEFQLLDQNSDGLFKTARVWNTTPAFSGSSEATIFVVIQAHRLVRNADGTVKFTTAMLEFGTPSPLARGDNLKLDSPFVSESWGIYLAQCYICT
jgi:hypothetical protein